MFKSSTASHCFFKTRVKFWFFRLTPPQNSQRAPIKPLHAITNFECFPNQGPSLALKPESQSGFKNRTPSPVKNRTLSPVLKPDSQSDFKNRTPSPVLKPDSQAGFKIGPPVRF